MESGLGSGLGMFWAHMSGFRTWGLLPFSRVLLDLREGEAITLRVVIHCERIFAWNLDYRSFGFLLNIPPYISLSSLCVCGCKNFGIRCSAGRANNGFSSRFAGRLGTIQNLPSEAEVIQRTHDGPGRVRDGQRTGTGRIPCVIVEAETVQVVEDKRSLLVMVGFEESPAQPDYPAALPRI